MSRVRTRRAVGSDGFIVVAVLWILATLAALAAVYTVYVQESMIGSKSDEERLQARALAWAGVEAAAYRLTENPDIQPTRGTLSFRMGRAEVVGEFRAENARIDLNLAPKEVLAGLFIGLGAQRDEAVRYAERINAWRMPVSADAPDKEAGLYGAAGKTYGPRHSQFQHVNELGLVVGIPQLLIDRAMPYLTVYSGQAEVNVLDAAPEVLAALPGLTPDRLQLLLSQRGNAPQDILRAQLGTAAQYANVQPSKANRVTVDVRFDAVRRYRSEAVVLLVAGDSEPFRVLSWEDDVPDTGHDVRALAGLR